MASYQTDVEYMLQVELNLGEGDNPMISEQDFIEVNTYVYISISFLF